MKSLERFYALLQYLSIDVVLGSMAMAFLFSKICDVSLVSSTYLILGICVWLIYTFDHLLDAKKIEGVAETRRHRFHQLYFRRLRGCWLILLCVGLILSFIFLPVITWYWGLVVVFFSVLHFVLIFKFGASKSKLVLKEIGVAWSYSVGVVVAPFSLLTTFKWSFVFIFILFFCVVFLNLIMFSYFDYFKDLKNKQSSIAVNYGLGNTRMLLLSLFGLVIFLCLGIILCVSMSAVLFFSVCFFFLISVFYVLMIVLVKHPDNSELFRKVSDLVFLLPLLLVFN